jgi:pimeloyl-ACP methyl ester carboxylesterase
LLAGSPPALHLTLVGHSYGSLAVGYAMRSSAPADDVVLAGSPGVGVRSALALTGKPGNVFVAEARGDAVADLHWFGADPSGRAFGALQLQTDGGIDALTGAELTASRGHSQYFRAGSESLRNIAAVTIGAPQLATYGDMSASGDHVLDIWR